MNMLNMTMLGTLTEEQKQKLKSTSKSTAQVAMNMLDMTMPGTLTEEQKQKNSKMPREESENGRDDMLIDGCEPEQPRGNSVPDGFNTNYLKVYYDGKHHACDRSYFGRREFSFTLDNDIYLRFQSFNSASELENSINEKCPVKIDIGPVYNVDVGFVYFIFAPAKA